MQTPIRAPLAPVLMIESLIDRDLCRALIAHWENGAKFSGPVSTATDARVVDGAAKIRDDVMIGPSPILDALRRAMVEKLVPSVREAFQFNITQFESFRVGCYDAAKGGFFRAHRDNTSPYTRHRKFALTLNLNTGEYEGGNLQFPDFASPPYEAAVGTGLVFSCSLRHESLPVTAGRRFGMFGFFYDDAGAALVETYRQAGQVT